MRQPEHLGLVMLAYVLMSGTTGTLGAMYGTVLHSPGRCCGLHWSTGQLRCSTLWGEELADLAGKSLPASMCRLLSQQWLFRSCAQESSPGHLAQDKHQHISSNMPAYLSSTEADVGLSEDFQAQPSASIASSPSL